MRAGLVPTISLTEPRPAPPRDRLGDKPGADDGELRQSVMTLSHALLLILSGVAGGAISSLVGGAALVTYPVLLAIGIPPVVATMCNLVALSPGNLLAAIYDRGQLPPFNRSFVALVIASLLGALVGALVLLVTPEHVFKVLVPILLGFATVLFAYAGRISAFVARAPAIATGARTAGATALVSSCRSRSMGAISAPASACCCWACCRSAHRATIAPPTLPRTW